MLKTLLFLFAPLVALAATPCSYEIDTSTLQVHWTAFKTNQKVGVNGSFSEVTLAGDLHDTDLAQLLGQLEAEIQVTGADKFRTGNPARDTTIYEKFFSLFKRKGMLKGEIHNVKVQNGPTPDIDTSGTFDLKLTVNQKTKEVPFKFTLTPAGAFNATGAINVLDFNLNGALASLHQACEALHTGTDGVSKTWPDVDLKLDATIRRSCN
jgi:polyisoprenoid-binding protein YceI